MKVIFISDTHTKHNDVILPDGDILIHAGDVSSMGRENEINDFIKWFKELPHKHKIFVGGNHDFFFEKAETQIVQNKIPKNVTYLDDSACSIEGLNIWGSPIQPEFFNWAFNRKRGKEIKKHWDLIPNNTDILITHGPPYGVLDKTSDGEHVGCEDLRNKVFEINPKIHVFGHIHEEYGIIKEKGIVFINASLLNRRYQYTNEPIVIEI